MATGRVKSHTAVSALGLNIYAKKCILRKNPKREDTREGERERK